LRDSGDIVGIASRIHDTIEDWQKEWNVRLRGWMASWLAFGIEVFFDVLGKSFSPKLKPMIEALEKTGQVPAELQPLLDELKKPTGEASGALGSMLGYNLIGGALGRMTEALFGVIGQEMSKARPTLIPSPPQFFDLFLRGEIDPEILKEGMLRHGWDEHWQELLLKLAHPLPPLPDMVRFADFGSFDPKIIELWREFYDAPGWIAEPMSLLGITQEWANKYWFSHWRQPGRYELGELHRRGEIDDNLVKNAYLTQGFSSFWQNKLLELVKEPWTRVDIRRMWDMRTISPAELRKAYQAVGYYGEQLDGMILWTKVYVAFPDLMDRWVKGWITIGQVREELTGLGMPAARVEEMIQTKVKAKEPERVITERELTKTDIYKGIKADRITRDEGVELLMDLGFDEDEADILLDVNIPEDETDKVVEERKVSKADILKGLKVGEITRAEAKMMLMELRYSSANAELLLRIYEALVKPPVEPKLKEASKADIVLGVKKGLIDQSEGYSMLLDLDFTPEAAGFILMVKTEESPFSPINYTEFKERTLKLRRAAGREVKPMPEELKKVAEEVVRLTGEVEALERSIEDERRGLIEGEILPEETTKRLKKLQVTKNRAIAELERVKSEYERLVAEWRHGLP